MPLLPEGNTNGEDVLLNLAGMFAPVVALVPVSKPGSCASVPGALLGREANIVNNVWALIAVGGLALAILIGLAFKNHPTGKGIAGFVVAGLVWLAGTLVFVLDDSLFVRRAHFIAAGLMFVCIFAVVCLNARDCKKKSSAPWAKNLYVAIAVAMLATSALIAVAGCLGWKHWILGIEGSLIFLFAIFWLIQTIELWKRGLRAPTSTASRNSAGAGAGHR